jgi:hypothetical protein
VRRHWPRVGSAVLVEWDDASSVDADDVTDHYLFETWGILIRRTRRSIYIAGERAKPMRDYEPFGPDRYRGVTRIPIGMVERIVKIA